MSDLLSNKTKNLSENSRSESNNSDLSDLSLSIDNKVFGGTLNLLNKNQMIFPNKDNIIQNPHSENNEKISSRKFCSDMKKININEIIDYSNSFEPISFRLCTHLIVEGAEKNYLENNSQLEFSTNCTIQNTLASSNNSANKFELIKNDLKSTTNIKIENSKRFEENQIYSEIEEKELAIFEAEQDIYDKNVFWNLKSDVVPQQNIENQLMKRCKSSLDNQINHSKLKANSFNSSQINCVFSKFEKGNAIFVSSDDIIFSLPMNFLPKNAIPGNSYKIRIEETEKINQKLTFLKDIQNKLFISNS